MSDSVRPTALWVRPDDYNRRPSRAILAGDWALERLRAAAVPIPSQNRLRAAIELLREFNVPGRQLDPTDVSYLERLGDAQRTISQQTLIVRHLLIGGEPPSALIEKLAVMLTGAEQESDDRNPIGRNTQFELYVATLIRLSGMNVQFEEPDIVFDYQGEVVGIAAKRLTSARQLNKRCREASEQVQRAGRRGFIALSTDILVRDLTPRDPCDEDREVYELLVSPLMKAEEWLVTKEHLIGTLLFASSQHWAFGGVRPKFWMKELQRHWPFVRCHADLIAFTEFAARLSVGSERAERGLYPE